MPCRVAAQDQRAYNVVLRPQAKTFVATSAYPAGMRGLDGKAVSACPDLVDVRIPGDLVLESPPQRAWL